MATIEIYEAEIASHDDSYNGICVPGDVFYSFKPIPRGKKWIWGIDRFCGGAKKPVATLEVPGEVVFGTKPDDFYGEVETATFGGDTVTPYRALALAKAATGA